MIYEFRYRHGEIEAEVEADSPLEACAKLQRGEAEYYVIPEALHPTMWELQEEN